jgi:hypothetical protein
MIASSSISFVNFTGQISATIFLLLAVLRVSVTPW